MFHICLEHFIHTACWQQKKESVGKKSENVNARHKLTPHSRDYVWLRRLINNNSSLSFFWASMLIAFPFFNNKLKPVCFALRRSTGTEAPC